MDQATIDDMTAQRMVHYLITPFSQWEAARIGIIDNQGNVKRAPANSSETRYFNLFHVLAIKLREIMKTSGRGTNFVLPATAGQFYLSNKHLPATNFTNWTIANRSALPFMSAAFSSMKECVKLDDDDNFVPFLEMYLKSPNQNDNQELSKLFEEGEVGNVSSQVVGIEQPLGVSIKNKYKAMNKIITRLKVKNATS